MVWLVVVTVIVVGSVLSCDGDELFAYLWKVFTVEAIKY